MNISFDYDGCLDCNVHLMTLARTLVSDGHQVFVLTGRAPDHSENSALCLHVSTLGIPLEHIIYSHDRAKSYYIGACGIVMHFDDNPNDVLEINYQYPGKAFLVHFDPSRLNFDNE